MTTTLRHSIIQMIMSKEFLTDGGVRCRALSNHGLFNFAEYHGSLPNWIVVTHTVAKGLHRQGYSRLARELWTRMICTVTVAGQFQEFCYFDTQGRLLLPEASNTDSATWILRAEEHSQKNQAWSISAVLEATQIMQNTDLDLQPSTDRHFEDAILTSITQYRNNPSELIAKLRDNMQIYRLEQVSQLAGAHEVDLSSVGVGGNLLRSIAIV